MCATLVLYHPPCTHAAHASAQAGVQVEGLMGVRKAGFESQGLVAVKAELDLVEADDQIEHEVRCAPKADCMLPAV